MSVCLSKRLVTNSMPCISVLSCSRADHCSISAAAGPVVLQQPSSLAQLTAWDAALALLRDAPQLTRGTPQQHAEAQQHAASCIQRARDLVQADSLWNECGQLVIALDKALALVLDGRVSQGRALAVEMIGFAQLQAQLAQQLKSVGLPHNANPPGEPSGQHTAARDRVICLLGGYVSLGGCRLALRGCIADNERRAAPSTQGRP